MLNDHPIELIDKLASIVEVLRREPNGSGLNELAARTGYGKSSIHRILQSLKQHGYVEQELRGGVYRLGIQFLLIARSVPSPGLVSVVRPHLQRLVAEFDETAYLALLIGSRGVFIDVEETRRDLRLVGPVGADVYFHATAAGKAMAAFLPPQKRKQLLNGAPLERLTPRTLVQIEDIEREWAAIREAGYAVNDEETIPGAVFAAAPVFDSSRAVCASVTMGIPKSRFSNDVRARLVPELVRSCCEISTRLEAVGYVSQSASPAACAAPAGRHG